MISDVLFVGSAILLGTASGAMIIAAALYTAYCFLIPRFEQREPVAEQPDHPRTCNKTRNSRASSGDL